MSALRAPHRLAALLALGAAAVGASPPLAYDPAAVEAGLRSLASAPVKRELSVRLPASGATLELTSDFRSDQAGLLLLGPGEAGGDPERTGCRLAAGGGAGDETRAECAVEVVRLAAWGASGDGRLAWLAYLPAGGRAPGTIRGPWRGGALAYPAALTLEIDWALVVEPAGGAPPLRLRAAAPALYQATLEGWPPYRADWPRPLVLTLANAPLPYFEEGRRSDDLSPSPYLVVEDERLSLGTQPTDFFEQRPQWTGASRSDGEAAAGGTRAGPGVELRWRPAASEAAPPVDAFRLYRNDRPGDLRGWSLVAEAPATTSSWFDPGVPPGRAVQYLLSRVVELPFGHPYEGAYGTVLTVEPAAPPSR